ncbi:hypothetical protein BJ684DRAFT_17743 [Piptocephalis cylindrospora]|uniref:ubiquitinyl hydrolase 1 n=1 Tax=Piptocephalis cylindrospora TaxID=1907219 RepID=A0A4P9XZ03_9FUNG|nr:hypothetical protein BJ684DRAFT_17743 [Piptocephalis cylindrospora]|eukprot:RKP11683.1 hypothetical protein BJ684DRAFT_17743 [Piptocephalis cylindrospora]
MPFYLGKLRGGGGQKSFTPPPKEITNLVTVSPAASSPPIIEDQAPHRRRLFHRRSPHHRSSLSSVKHAKHLPSELIKDLTCDPSIHVSSKLLEEMGLEYREARRGHLISPPSPSRGGTVLVGGLLNDNGTSCYMDSVVFALFATSQAYDALINPPNTGSASRSPSPFQPASSRVDGKTAEELRTQLRVIVNRLRSARHVSIPLVAHLRRILRRAGWVGERETQEDATELFLHLTSILGGPLVPLTRTLTYPLPEDPASPVKSKGGKDTTITSERFLTLPLPDIPSPSSSSSSPRQGMPLILEDLIRTYLRGNNITGLEREGRRVDAQEIIQVHPFWTSESPAGVETHLRRSAFPTLSLPMMLPRYTWDLSTGSAIRDDRGIACPLVLDWSKARLAPVKDAYLVLHSAVCHEGNSPQSGHYTSWTLSQSCLRCWKADDLDSPPISSRTMTEMLRDVSLNGYLLFYECWPSSSLKAFLRGMQGPNTRGTEEHKGKSREDRVVDD